MLFSFENSYKKTTNLLLETKIYIFEENKKLKKNIKQTKTNGKWNLKKIKKPKNRKTILFFSCVF
jgi:hypothetical protein